MKALFKLIEWCAAIAAVLLCYAGYHGNNPLLYLPGACIVGLMLVFHRLNDRWRYKENTQTPITTVEAKITGHRFEQERAGKQRIIRYYITFRPTDGSRSLEFQVSQLDFEDFDVGETGPLRYRGWEFLSFGVTDKSGFTPMAPLAEEYEAKPEPKSGWQRQAERMRSMWKRLRTKPAQPEAIASDNDDGILTHELDE